MREWEEASSEPESAEQSMVSHQERSQEPPDLETVLHLMWDRLEKLEADRRRLQRAATIALAGLAVVIAAFAANLLASVRSDDPSGPMILKDSAGIVRARLETDAETGATVLQLLGSDGRPQAKLAADDSGSGLTFYDREGDPRLRMGVVSETPTLDLIDKAEAKQTRHDLGSGRTTSRRLAGDDEPYPPEERARPGRRAQGVVSKYHRLPAPSRSTTCWPGTLGCSSGVSSRVDDAPGGPG
ncbi:MAG: hypothetical protein ACREQQ_06855 [Candidatus Binatia bacterium]